MISAAPGRYLLLARASKDHSVVVKRNLPHGRFEDRVIDLQTVAIGGTDISHRHVSRVEVLLEVIQKKRTVLLLPKEKAAVGKGINRLKQRGLLKRIYEMRFKNSMQPRKPSQKHCVAPSVSHI